MSASFRLSAASFVLTLHRKLHGLASTKPRKRSTLFSHVTRSPSYSAKLRTTLPFTALRANTRLLFVSLDVLIRKIHTLISCHFPPSKRQIFARTSCDVFSSSSPWPCEVSALESDAPASEPVSTAGAELDTEGAAGACELNEKEGLVLPNENEGVFADPNEKDGLTASSEDLVSVDPKEGLADASNVNEGLGASDKKFADVPKTNDGLGASEGGLAGVPNVNAGFGASEVGFGASEEVLSEAPKEKDGLVSVEPNADVVASLDDLGASPEAFNEKNGLSSFEDLGASVANKEEVLVFESIDGLDVSLSMEEFTFAKVPSHFAGAMSKENTAKSLYGILRACSWSSERPAGMSRLLGGVTIHHDGTSTGTAAGTGAGVEDGAVDTGTGPGADGGVGACWGSLDAVVSLGSFDASGRTTSSAGSRGRLATAGRSKAVADLGRRDVSCGTSDASDMDGGIVSYMEPEAGTSASDCSSVFMAKGEGLFGLFVTCHRDVSCVESRDERRGSVRSTTSSSDDGLSGDGDAVLDARCRAASRALARVESVGRLGWVLFDRVWYGFTISGTAGFGAAGGATGCIESSTCRIADAARVERRTGTSGSSGGFAKETLDVSVDSCVLRRFSGVVSIGSRGIALMECVAGIVERSGECALRVEVPGPKYIGACRRPGELRVVENGDVENGTLTAGDRLVGVSNEPG